MTTLKKIDNKVFPFSWMNLDYYPNSKGSKKEIYLVNYESIIDDLISLFFSLFSSVKRNLKIYNSSWWDYCLETWNPNTNEYDYSLIGKSQETIDYLNLLSNSSIDLGYSGSCICLDWDKFLKIIIECLIMQKAPYSPLFYDDKNNFFFYFHHTGSIGLYYYEENETIIKILSLANTEYDVR